MITLTNLRDATAMLDDVSREFATIDFAGFVAAETVALELYHRATFATQADPVGAAWPALAPSTVRRKGHAKILIHTGRLQASLTGRSGDAVRVSQGSWPNLTIEFGTTVPYSRYHSRLDGHARRLPRREHVGVNAKHIDDAAQHAADFALRSLTRERNS